MTVIIESYSVLGSCVRFEKQPGLVIVSRLPAMAARRAKWMAEGKVTTKK